MPTKKKIIVAFGTRPELIRFAPIIHRLLGKDEVELSLVHTGQHYSDNMNEVFFRELDLPAPDVNLGAGGVGANEQMVQIIAGMDRIIAEKKPETVVVWGDTNSSLGVAIAANKRTVKLVHIEAGARSGDFRMAEEYNRILIDHLSDLLFPLSRNDQENLTREKVHGYSHFLGDPLYDVFLEKQKQIQNYQSKNLAGLTDRNILLTLHRAENVDDKKTLKNILLVLNKIKGAKIIFPIHPRTEKMVKSFGLNPMLESGSIKTVTPLSYLEILKLLQQVDLVITDSGGLQKEAFFAQKTCATVRKSTEWLDTVRLGVNFVLDPKSDQLNRLPRVFADVQKINKLFTKMTEKPYGDGKSAQKIITTLIDF